MKNRKKELETISLEMAKTISEYDCTIFFNSYFKRKSIDAYNLKINDKDVIISKIIEIDRMYIPGHHIHPFGYPPSHTDDIYSQFLDQVSQDLRKEKDVYGVHFSFDKNGILQYYALTDTNMTLVEVFVGDKKLYTNGKWVDIEGLHESAFQQSCVDSPEPFGNSFLSQLLTLFKIGE